MFLTIIFLPAIGSFFTGLFGRKLGVTGAQLITTCCVSISTLLTLVAFFEVGLANCACTIYLANWINSDSLSIQ